MRGVEDGGGGGGGGDEGSTPKSDSSTSAASLLRRREILVEALGSGVAVEVKEVQSAIVERLVMSSLSGLSLFFLASGGKLVFFTVVVALDFVGFLGSPVKDLKEGGFVDFVSGSASLLLLCRSICESLETFEGRFTKDLFKALMDTGSAKSSRFSLSETSNVLRTAAPPAALVLGMSFGMEVVLKVILDLEVPTSRWTLDGSVNSGLPLESPAAASGISVWSSVRSLFKALRLSC